MIYSQSYLQKLIDNRIEENLHLDYKASGALDRANLSSTKDGISKDVAAFANADGGILIYGLSENKDARHIASRIDPIDRKIISREWLEQVIQTAVEPRVEGITIHPVEIDGDIHKVVYVVEVPKSFTAHQSSDHKYYKRHNFNILAMHDYEIRDIMNRVKHPKIIIEIGLHTQHDDQEDGYHLAVYAKNTSGVLANYINCFITIPSKSLLFDDDPYGSSIFNLTAENTVQDYLGHNDRGIEYGPKRYRPILPQTRSKLSFMGNIVLNRHFKKYELKWIVYADSAAPLAGTVQLKDIDVLHY